MAATQPEDVKLFLTLLDSVTGKKSALQIMDKGNIPGHFKTEEGFATLKKMLPANAFVNFSKTPELGEAIAKLPEGLPGNYLTETLRAIEVARNTQTLKTTSENPYSFIIAEDIHFVETLAAKTDVQALKPEAAHNICAGIYGAGDRKINQDIVLKLLDRMTDEQLQFIADADNKIGDDSKRTVSHDANEAIGKRTSARLESLLSAKAADAPSLEAPAPAAEARLVHA